jgi:hypothetical protein
MWVSFVGPGQLQSGEYEQGDAPVRLHCVACGQRVAARIGVGGNYCWEKADPRCGPVEGLITDPRDLPDEVANRTRPCPWVSCRCSLVCDVNQRGGLTLNYPDLNVWERSATCALDVCDQGGVDSLPELCGLLDRSYDRGFQICAEALVRARDVAVELGGGECPWEKGKRGKPSTLAARPARSNDTEDCWIGLGGIEMPTFRKAPFRQLTPEEVARLYPGAAVSTEYGQPRPHLDAPDSVPSGG